MAGFCFYLLLFLSNPLQTIRKTCNALSIFGETRRPSLTLKQEMKTGTGSGMTNHLAAWRRASYPDRGGPYISHILRNSQATPGSQKAEEWAEPGILGGGGKAGSKTEGLTEVFVVARLSSEDTKWLMSGGFEPESIQI